MPSFSPRHIGRSCFITALAILSVNILLSVQAQAGTKINPGDLLGRQASGQNNDQPAVQHQNEQNDSASVNALARKRWNLPANARFENTVVPDVFALRVTGRTGGACSQFVNGNVTQVANLGGLGWKQANGSPLNPAAQLEVSQRAARAVLSQAIRVGPKTNHYPFLLISGVDCPACRMLETQLANLNASYLVIPVALSPENTPIAAKIWVSADAGRDWQQVMTGKSNGPRSSKGGLSNYPGEAFHDVSCMFGGVTPRAIFPDGRQLNRTEEILAALKSGADNSPFYLEDTVAQPGATPSTQTSNPPSGPLALRQSL